MEVHVHFPLAWYLIKIPKYCKHSENNVGNRTHVPAHCFCLTVRIILSPANKHCQGQKRSEVKEQFYIRCHPPPLPVDSVIVRRGQR